MTYILNMATVFVFNFNGNSSYTISSLKRHTLYKGVSKYHVYAGVIMWLLPILSICEPYLFIIDVIVLYSVKYLKQKFEVWQSAQIP